MNIFRIFGDSAHLLAICILIFKILKSQSCTGVSGKSQILFALTYTARYLDLFFNYISIYNSVMKIVYLTASYITLYLIYHHFRTTYNQNDTFRIEILLLPTAILSLLVNHYFDPFEILWTFSIYLESVAILPQFFMILKMGESEKMMLLYLFLRGSYRGFYIMNWIYRYYFEYTIEWIAFVSGVIQTSLYCIFLFLYLMKDSPFYRETLNPLSEKWKKVGGKLQPIEEFWESSQEVISSHRKLLLRAIKDRLKGTLKKENTNDNIESNLPCLADTTEDKNLDKETLIVSQTNSITAESSVTTSPAVLWFLQLMAFFPDVQARVQAEIDSIVPRLRSPLKEDIASLPFTEATLYEALRLSHSTLDSSTTGEEKEQEDASILQETTKITNFKNWDKPTEFNPARNLDSEGNLIAKTDFFYPFSTEGRESFSDLFLSCASQLQNFSFEIPEGGENASPLTDSAPLLQGLPSNRNVMKKSRK
ncbi:UNVERIFIED_CONTAM: hypothetical protein GTU68_044453 [Idotea baltica]|nr:hypothetical protein [Idotea baltica]